MKSSSESQSLDRPTRSIRLLQTDRIRLKIISGTNGDDLHTRRTNIINDKIITVYLASFGRKFITDLIQLIGSTSPKFDA